MTLALTSAGEAIIKVDIGCGSRKREGCIGLDRIAFEGVDRVLEIGTERWPFKDASVDEAYTCHFLEHLTSVERVHFCNELQRILVKGGKCQVIVPHWASCRAYGDPTHQWPPVSEFWFYYLDRKWRMENAPHTDSTHWIEGFDCDFEVTWGYQGHPALASRNAEMQQFAFQFYKESVQDMHATMTKK